MDIFRMVGKKVKVYFENNHKIVPATWGAILFSLIGGIDSLVIPEISLSFFYLLPISFVTWFVKKEAGIITAFASVVAIFSLNNNHQPNGSALLSSYWENTVILMFFLTVCYLVFELRAAKEREKEIARIDHITGLANKRLFFELARLEVKKSIRYRHPITVIDIDIDDFTSIYDKLGQSIGNKLLQIVAETLKDSIRETDIMGRIGSDEFVILLPGSGHEPAQVVANRVQKQLREAMETHKWSVTFSIGAVTFINPPNSVDAMIQRADHLMYLVKNNGKNQLKHIVSL
ncbi:GGDEF domain-containing protein [Microcoleus sp. FACHB-SPT15]|uniref:GGDEF domain-containing protein n=1 Tax=Microcoleus sp. FACHB-SPT15 TaxID=2692830 RepID=UPI001782A077|nr:GGDEF domain-containing protein [Microcoleus sp. FACHB-SPT15]